MSKLFSVSHDPSENITENNAESSKNSDNLFSGFFDENIIRTFIWNSFWSI